MRMLNIETKENSTEKLAAVAGKPTKHFLFAGEINRMASAINSLRNLLIVNQENIDALIAQSESIDLGDITGEEFVDVLNQMELVEIGSSGLIIYTIADVKYVQTFLGVSNNYGSSTSLTLTAQDFALIYQSDSQTAQLSEYDFYGTLKQVGNNPPTVIVGRSNFPEPITITEPTNGNYLLYFPSIPFTNKTHFTLGPLNIRPVDDNTGKALGLNSGSFIVIRTVNQSTGLAERGYLNEGVSIHIKHIL